MKFFTFGWVIFFVLLSALLVGLAFEQPSHQKKQAYSCCGDDVCLRQHHHER